MLRKGKTDFWRLKRLVLILLCCLPVLSVPVQAQNAPLRIGLSKTSPNYISWLKRSDSSVITVNLYTLSIDSALTLLAECDGLVVTGGEDIYPGLYGKDDAWAKCADVNRHRDSLDFALVRKAIKEKIPLIGICRGCQMMNVVLKGTLLPDIPEKTGNSVIHRQEDYLHCYHRITVVEHSFLGSLCHCDSGRVTSNHHQAVERISPVLRFSACSPDGIIESIEWKKPGGKPFLLGVQWHPERMEKDNPLSGLLADAFLRECSLNHNTNKLTRK